MPVFAVSRAALFDRAARLSRASLGRSSLGACLRRVVRSGPLTVGRLVVAAAASIGCVAAASAQDAARVARVDGAYDVSPLDTLEVKVAQWSASERTMVAIDFLTGSYQVDAGGAVQLPVLGRMNVAGDSLAEITSALQVGLQQNLGIVDDLFISVRVDTFAPIFVIGAVQAPGQFEYHPGLRALQAVALAGGAQRSQSLFTRTDRDAVRSLGDYRLLEVERYGTLAQIARLEAELNGSGVITMPEELKGTPFADELVDVETEILHARRDDHQSALTALADYKQLVRARIAKLREEMVLRERLLGSARSEVESVKTLVERGLAATSRANSVERTLAELESRMLELETAILQAEQQLSEADRDEVDLKGKRRVTIVTELQAGRTELSQIKVKVASTEALYAEAARFGSTMTQLADELSDRDPTLLITRNMSSDEDSEARVIQATTTTLLRPGDVIEVRAPELDASQIEGYLAPRTPTLIPDVADIN